MKCAEAEKLLAMRLTGDLHPDHTQRLKSHLHECADCAAKAEGYNRLRAGLLFLQEAYQDLDAPFTFDPADCTDRGRTATGRVFTLARAALATAAALALVVVLWPTKMTDESSSSVSADGTGVPRIVESGLTVRVCRTPAVWPGMDQVKQLPEDESVRVPRLPTLTQPPYRGVSGIRCKTPTLVTQKRRILRHDDSQSHHDHRSGRLMRGSARSHLG